MSRNSLIICKYIFWHFLRLLRFEAHYKCTCNTINCTLISQRLWTCLRGSMILCFNSIKSMRLYKEYICIRKIKYVQVHMSSILINVFPCSASRGQHHIQRKSWIDSPRSWCMTWIIHLLRNILVLCSNMLHPQCCTFAFISYMCFNKGHGFHCLHLSPSGRCARCGDNVLGDGSGCIAMEQVFHVECFTCITCHARLRGQPFYALDRKSYCESCYIVSSVYRLLVSASYFVFFFLHINSYHLFFLSAPRAHLSAVRNALSPS